MRALSLLVKIGVVALLLWAALTFVFGVYRMAGNAMYPSLRDGDLVFTYKPGEVYAGDVVAYETPDGIHLSRVVARAGDEVDFASDGGGYLLNGAPPTEEVFYPTEMTSGAPLPASLGEGEYFLLNDYREDVGDSRSYGVIPRSALRGKLLFLIRRRGF